MHEYHSQHRVVTIATLPLLVKHLGKHSSGTFYVAFRDLGQILIIRDSWSLCNLRQVSMGKEALSDWVVKGQMVDSMIAVQ